MTTSQPDPGPADDAHPGLDTGSATPLGDDGGGPENDREVGVTAAVERGPLETSDEGEPLRLDPDAVLEDTDERARSTDDL